MTLGPLPFAVLWSAWLIYWGVTSRGARARERVEARASWASHTLPLIAGAILMAWVFPPGSWPTTRFLPAGIATYGLGLATTMLGLALTVWARVHLGRNWSATIAANAQHELVRSGPYAWVRHPIYAGLLLAFAGGVIVRGDLSALAGSAVMVFALVRKQRLEERWLSELFGAAYASYRDDVPALMPRWLRVVG